MRYLAFEYTSAKFTTTGQPNKVTKKLSIAGDLVCFDSKKDRDNWVSKGKNTCDMAGKNNREKVNFREARKLLAGYSVEEFNELIEMIEKY